MPGGVRAGSEPETWGRDPGREEAGQGAAARQEGGADPPCPGLPPQRLYSMDLRSSHKARARRKLCFSLTPTPAAGPEGVVKAGAPELADKGPLVPTLPFPLMACRPTSTCGSLTQEVPPRGQPGESQPSTGALPAGVKAQDVLQAASEWEPAKPRRREGVR